jgi:hypothetical protein
METKSACSKCDDPIVSYIYKQNGHTIKRCTCGGYILDVPVLKKAESPMTTHYWCNKCNDPKITGDGTRCECGGWINQYDLDGDMTFAERIGRDPRLDVNIDPEATVPPLPVKAKPRVFGVWVRTCPPSKCKNMGTPKSCDCYVFTDPATPLVQVETKPQPPREIAEINLVL